MNNINRKGKIEIKIVMNHTKQNDKTYSIKQKSSIYDVQCIIIWPNLKLTIFIEKYNCINVLHYNIVETFMIIIV